MLRALFFWMHNRIGRRLIVAIITFSSFTTLVITIAQLSLEYYELRNGIEQQFDEIGVYVANVSASVWDFDDKQIQLALNALTKLPNIEHASVASPSDKHVWVDGRVKSSSTITRIYPLSHESPENGWENIGRLEVVASLSVIYRQLAERALSILVANGLKTFAVALFMVALFRQQVTNRLEKLASKVASIAPESLPLEQEEPKPMPPQYDELQAVEWVLDNTTHSLGIAAAALKNLNLELVERIAEKEALLQNALVGIVMLRNREIVSCNRRFEELFGYPHGSMIGLSTRVLYLSEQDWFNAGAAAYGTLDHAPSFSTTTVMVRHDGTRFWAEAAGRRVSAGAQGESIWIFSDVTERKRVEELLAHQAMHDALTGLPNRLLAQDRLEQAFGAAQREGSYVGVLFMDLDRFKNINDSLGHAAGDDILMQVTARLLSATRATDTVSRQGGDEFMIVAPDATNEQEFADMAQKILGVISAPYFIGQQEMNLTFSIGISVYPHDGINASTLIKNADAAMYHAKEEGRNNYQFYAAAMNDKTTKRFALETQLRHAVARQEFVVYYQPKVDAVHGKLVGAEALIRWNHPESGLLGPSNFIGIAEESGLIVQMGQWVMEQVCKQSQVWREQGLTCVPVSVNLSAAQFRNKALVETLRILLDETAMPSGLLGLELVENLLMDDSEAVVGTMRQLKALGVNLSIDDFGTGYSSLSYLKHFPIDTLKIDQSFVRDIAHAEGDDAIITAIISMAHSLKMSVIAEGVETQAQLTFLAANHCDEIQGYFFSKPVPAAEFEAMLATTTQERTA